MYACANTCCIHSDITTGLTPAAGANAWLSAEAKCKDASSEMDFRWLPTSQLHPVKRKYTDVSCDMWSFFFNSEENVKQAITAHASCCPSDGAASQGVRRYEMRRSVEYDTSLLCFMLETPPLRDRVVTAVNRQGEF